MEPTIFHGTPVVLQFAPAGNPGTSQAFSVVPLFPSGTQATVDSGAWTVEGEGLELVPDAGDWKVANGNALDVSETKHCTVRCTIDADRDAGEERLLIAEWAVTVLPYEAVSLHLTP